MVDALGPNTLQAIALAGPELQVICKLLLGNTVHVLSI